VLESKVMAKSLPGVLPWSESFDVGTDAATPVDDQDYQVPFRFTGKLTSLTVKLGKPGLKKGAASIESPQKGTESHADQ
jgi:arylsulfatase